VGTVNVDSRVVDGVAEGGDMGLCVAGEGGLMLRLGGDFLMSVALERALVVVSVLLLLLFFFRVSGSFGLDAFEKRQPFLIFN
jgi:hypothetical protein